MRINSRWLLDLLSDDEETGGGASVRIRFGGGVVNQVGNLGIAAMIAAAACAYAAREHPLILISVVAILLVAFVLVAGALLLFAHIHEDAALMGGTELLNRSLY